MQHAYFLTNLLAGLYSHMLAVVVACSDVSGLALVSFGFQNPEPGRIEHLSKPQAWHRLNPGLVDHIWLLLPKASKCIVERHWNNEKDWKLKK